MSLWRFILLVLAAAGALGASGTSAEQCIEFDDPAELFARNDAVFIGTVVAHEGTGAKGAHMSVDIATLQVQRVWKGDLDGRVEVWADHFFEVDKPYLVFAGDSPLSTTIPCKATVPLESAGDKLEWLSTRKTIPMTTGGAKSLDPRIPAPVDARFRDVRDGRNWSNPRLTIMANGIQVSSGSIPGGSTIVPVERLRRVLMNLPVEAWPYGRVVMAADTGIASADRSDQWNIGRNHKTAAIILKDLGVRVDWWPSA